MVVSNCLQWLRDLPLLPTTKLCSDSREIMPGDVFIAYVTGSSLAHDGRRYIPHAIERGAVAVIIDKTSSDPSLVRDDIEKFLDQHHVPHYAVDALAQCVGEIANAYYNHPDQTIHVVAVTGTNGKTSCTQWVAQALAVLKQTSAVIGTLGLSILHPTAIKRTYHDLTHTFPIVSTSTTEFLHHTGYTTPNATALNTCLQDLHRRNVTALALEASSIGLVEHRLQGLHVDVAVLTNLTQDHLDYHGDMQRYEAAKTRLFFWPGLQAAVVNIDDPMGKRLIAALTAQPITQAPRLIAYSLYACETTLSFLPMNAMLLSAKDIRHHAHGITFTVVKQTKEQEQHLTIKTPLIGDFNISNTLAVLGALLALDIPWPNAAATLKSLQPIPGRMAPYGGIDAPLVIIDYAHTPDALDKVLHSLRQIAHVRQGKLWCVFGCGGNRDFYKRPQMGAVASQADHLIITNDNPRNEDPQAIMAAILAGIALEKQEHTLCQVDRAAAILRAVKTAKKNDVVLIAGKGHETMQEIQGKHFPFIDAEHVQVALGARVRGGVT